MCKMALDLTVDSVDYYTRNKELELVERDLNHVNSNGEAVLTVRNLIGKKLYIKGFKDEGPLENDMESAFHYIKAHPNVLKDQEIVCGRQCLKKIPMKVNIRGDDRICAYLKNGKIFMRRLGNVELRRYGTQNWENFARSTAAANLFLTNFHQKGTADKSVNHVRISSKDSATNFCVFAELDGHQSNSTSEEETQKNIEIKSTIFNLPDWLRRRSCETYWHCILGNVQKVVLVRVKRVEKPEIAENSVQAVNTFTPEELASGRQWSVAEGVQRLMDFRMALDNFLLNKDSIVIEREWGEWKECNDCEVPSSFKDLVDSVNFEVDV